MHLQRFTDADGLIWVYDRKHRFEPRRDTPRNVANEKFLYAPGEGSDDPKSDVFEDWLAEHIDGPAAPAMARVVDSRKPNLSNAERSRLAAYVSAQDLRTPKLRTFLLERFQAELQDEWPNIVRAALEALGEPATPESVAAVSAEYELKVNKTIWLDFFGEHVNKAAERLHHMAWCTISAPPTHPFLLNDVGVVKLAGDFHTPIPHMPGWWPPITHWLVPLSPTIALGISPDRRWGYATAKPVWMELVNRQIALDAHEYVFASRPSDEVPSWWAEASSPAV